MRWLKQHYTGYVRVRLTGRSPERFFNLCRSSKILLWNIACEKEEYWFFLLLPDFYRIRPFARKAGVRVRIQEKLGLPFFLYRNRKRKLFAVGAASFFLLLFVLSHFIWNISFSGNLLFTDDMLTGQLREIGVCYGMPKRGVDCDRIEEELRSRCPGLSGYLPMYPGPGCRSGYGKMRQRMVFPFGKNHQETWWLKQQERSFPSW